MWKAAAWLTKPGACAVPNPPCTTRIDQAHRKLSRWLADQNATRKAQRALVEKLQASVRRGV